MTEVVGSDLLPGQGIRAPFLSQVLTCADPPPPTASPAHPTCPAIGPGLVIDGSETNGEKDPRIPDLGGRIRSSIRAPGKSHSGRVLVQTTTLGPQRREGTGRVFSLFHTFYSILYTHNLRLPTLKLLLRPKITSSFVSSDLNVSLIF